MEHQDFCLHIDAASPLEKYPAKQHARRVAQILGVEKGLIYLPGAPTAYLEDSDQFVTFRQRRYFYYLSGVDESDCHLTYDIRLDTLVLYVPEIGSPRKVYYNGRGSTPDEALEKYDIDAVHYSSAVADYVEFWMTQHEGDVYILHPEQAVLPGHDQSPRVNYTKLQQAIDAARVRKDPHEIKLIRKANEISAKAHANVLKNILKFKNEAQVEAVFLDTCVAADAKHQAYEIIAASGENAATLHYIKNDELFADRQLMCLDAGSEWQCYASDVTRTFPLTGQWPSKEAKEIYDLVQKIQTACIEAIKPGARYLDIHYLAHRILIDGLLELGIFHNGTAQEIFDAGTSLAFLPHGLGHHLGLEVHDVSDVPLMAATPQSVSPVVDLEMCKALVHPSHPALEEGMIVTVEPGIYFNRFALSAVYFPDPTHSKYINKPVLLRYLPVGGVRIEDDILVTDDGYENLTTAPKGEEMLRLIQEGLGEMHEDKEPKPRAKTIHSQQGQRHGDRRPMGKNEMVGMTGVLSPMRNLSVEDTSSVPTPVPQYSAESGKSTRAVSYAELEGCQTGVETHLPRSRPVSMSAAPASFEAVGWFAREEPVAAELPSEPDITEQELESTERRPSHWRKVPPALARMASTRSLSASSSDGYMPSQMFQRPRQAPAPPQKLPELPAKPLEYRQSMPIIGHLPNDCSKSVSSHSDSQLSATGRERFRPSLEHTEEQPFRATCRGYRHMNDTSASKPALVEHAQKSLKEQSRTERKMLHRASIAVDEHSMQQMYQDRERLQRRLAQQHAEQQRQYLRQQKERTRQWQHQHNQLQEHCEMVYQNHLQEQRSLQVAREQQRIQQQQRLQQLHLQEQHQQRLHGQPQSKCACSSGSACEVESNSNSARTSPTLPATTSSTKPNIGNDVHDWQRQLKLLEHQNKIRKIRTLAEQGPAPGNSTALQDYSFQLMLVELENKERLRLQRELGALGALRSSGSPAVAPAAAASSASSASATSPFAPAAAGAAPRAFSVASNSPSPPARSSYAAPATGEYKYWG